jgi:hypothetical protein
MKKYIILLITVFGLLSCTDTIGDNTQNCGTVTNVPFESFSYCGILKENPTKASFVILNSNEDVLKIFSACPTFDVAMPDFTQKRILGLYAGPKPTGGYAIKIQSVQEDDCQIIVEYFEKEPKKDELVTTVVTYPSDYVVLPKSQKPISFKRVYENVDSVVIGTYNGQCIDNGCQLFYKIDSQKVLQYLKVNVGAYDFTQYGFKALKYKDDLAAFAQKIPSELKSLKGQTKIYGSPDTHDQGGTYFEYNQGGVVTKVFFDNDATTDQNESILAFKKIIQDKIVELKTKQ